MERNYFEKIHRNEIWDYIKKRQPNDSHFLNIENLSIKGTKTTTTIFCLLKTHQKKHVEVASICHPSKLYRKCALKWCRLFAHRNYIKKARRNDVEIRWYWCVEEISAFIQHVESVGITEQNWFWCQPKIIVVSTLNFDVILMLIKWHCFDVEIRLSLQRSYKDYNF